MFELLNDIAELVFVTALDTYELLYANQAVKKSFHLESLEGIPCYAALQGRTSPCPYCPKNKLKPSETYVWEHTNELNHRHYYLKDQLIEWEWRQAHLEIAFDITAVEQEKRSLQSALNSEKMMMEIVRGLYQASTVAEAMDGTLSRLGSFLSAERTYIFEICGDRMSNTYEWCAPGISPEIGNLQGMDTALLHRWMPYFLKHDCVVIEDLEALRESSPDEYENLSVQGIHSLVATPLEKDGTLIGYIGVDNPPTEKLQNISVFLHTLRYFLMSTMQRLEDEQLLKKLSFCDTLTGLYNRNRYMQDVEVLSEYEGSLGVVYLDINGLKDINDKFGHARGDEAIAHCAEKIKQLFSSEDIYRIGGDEFIIICKNMKQEDFEARSFQLRGCLSSGDLCRVAIGCQWERHAQDMNIQILISSADARMYEDKKQYYHAARKSNRYRHHNDTILRLTLPNTLRRDLEQGRFIVYLQPKVSLADRRPMGAEALVRYQAPDGTFYLPGQFIPLLENAQLISQVDFYVFEFACQKIGEWISNGKRAVPLSVNFSKLSLMEPKVVERLAEICGRYGVERHWLEIEMTETADMLDKQPVCDLIRRIRDAGFRVSIDDFGTHFSNLMLLTSIDFDELKIDRSLVENIASNQKAQAVMGAVAEVCRKMDIRMIVEGIETEEQLTVLKRLGFENAQGYLFGRPVAVEDYERTHMIPERPLGDA